ncbi:MAG: hypothetical protein HOE90_07860 [Bacteriovoracaceae bacterium]|jgi:hypothetical protein|nr:hypothetical protein [Bacteriovoracaceae bacterium]
MLNESQIQFLKDAIKIEAQRGYFLHNECKNYKARVEDGNFWEFATFHGDLSRKPIKLALTIIAAIEASQGSVVNMEWLRLFFQEKGEFNKFLNENMLNTFYRPESAPKYTPDDNLWSRRLKNDLWRSVLSPPLKGIVKNTSGSKNSQKKQFHIESYISPLLKCVEAAKSGDSMRVHLQLLEDEQNNNGISYADAEFFKKKHPDYFNTELKNIKVHKLSTELN